MKQELHVLSKRPIPLYTIKTVFESCDNIGLVGVSAKWSYVTASSGHHDQAIPILSPSLFKYIGGLALFERIYLS